MLLDRPSEAPTATPPIGGNNENGERWRAGTATGFGSSLAAAFERTGRLPALHTTRLQFEAVLANSDATPRDIAETVVSDLGLASAILRSANHPRRGSSGRIGSLAEAVEMLPREVLMAIGERIATYDFFGRDPMWGVAVEQFRIHAVSTQLAAARIAAIAGYRETDTLLLEALFHDIGKLILVGAQTTYEFPGPTASASPEDRLATERRMLRIDHCVIGAVLLRRWHLPATLATTIAKHHDPDCEGAAAIVRLADMLAHYHAGARVGAAAISHAARQIGLTDCELRGLLSAAPAASRDLQRHGSCPLSPRELGVLRGFAAGGVYEDVATSMGLSQSTVRSHLASAARKMRVRDRAHAVLVATERGWL